MKNRRQPSASKSRPTSPRGKFTFVSVHRDLDEALKKIDPTIDSEGWVRRLIGASIQQAKRWIENGVLTVTVTDDNGTPMLVYDCLFLGKPGKQMGLVFTLVAAVQSTA